jgi:hypothetical protein
VAEHDLAADGDLVVVETEGEGLYGQCLIDPGSEVERADQHVIHGRGRY